MKKRILILLGFTVLFAVLAAFAVPQPTGHIFAALHLTHVFWIPVFLMLSEGCAAAALFLLRRLRREAGRKGTAALVFGIMFLAAAAAEGYIALSRYSMKSASCTLRHYESSPDGQHSVYRVERSDLLGNTCCDYYQQIGTFRWAYVFDADIGAAPQIEWCADGLTYREHFHPYQP